MSGQGMSFSTPENDPNIPKIDAHRRKYCQSLVGALKNISHVQGSSSSAFKSRWAAGAPRKYQDVDIEITC
jgi:hypothetical protein